ncbi:MAG: shikimate kinase [Acidimicrobiales bacterium]
MARLVLVGLPGVGKSTVAQALAQRWRCDALDTDDVIAIAVAMPAAQYLREFGEPHFREREFEALHSALESDAVIATGAGIVTSERARQLIEREFAVWLDVDDETLLERVAVGERPLLGDDHAQSLKRLRGEREEWYRKSARVRVDAGGSLDDVLDRVMAVTREVSS